MSDIEWGFGEEEWEGDPGLLEERSRQRSQWPSRIWRALGVLFLLGLIAGGGWLRWQVNLRHEALRADLQRVLDAELAAIPKGDVVGFLALQDPHDPEWLLRQELLVRWWRQAGHPEAGTIEDVALGSGGQVATATVLLRNRAATRRETWYYRFTGQGWRHTAADRIPPPLARSVTIPAWHEAMLDYTIRQRGDGEGTVIIRYRGVAGGQKMLHAYSWPAGLSEERRTD